MQEVLKMIDPYVVSLGEELYRKLFDDYYRPENFTVQQWVVDILNTYLNGGFDDYDSDEF